MSENVDLRCVCGARWAGGPLHPAVAARFRAFFEEEHSAHTDPPSAEDLADLVTMEDGDR